MRPNNSTKLFHVMLVTKGTQRRTLRQEFEINLHYEFLEKRFLSPYRKGKPIVIKGKTIAMDHLEQIRLFNSEHEIASLENVLDQMEITQEFITLPPGSDIETVHHPDIELAPPTDAREVFIVHGRNLAARDALFDFLRAIDLHPLEWSEAVQSTGRASPYIGDILTAAFSKAHAVVVLMTPDDDAQLREPLRSDNDPPHETELSGQARPNVLFEAGMAMGRNEDRTILVELGTLKPFSDVAGRHVIRFDNTTQRRQELARRLQTAGCPVNLDGTDWHTTGDFEAAFRLAVQESSESAVAAEQQSTNTETPQLSEEAKELLIEATKVNSGLIQKIGLANGKLININGKALNELGNRRSEAKWEGALDELIERRLVKDYNGKGEAFEVTHNGFEVTDTLKGPSQTD